VIVWDHGRTRSLIKNCEGIGQVLHITPISWSCCGMNLSSSLVSINVGSAITVNLFGRLRDVIRIHNTIMHWGLWVVFHFWKQILHWRHRWSFIGRQLLSFNSHSRRSTILHGETLAVLLLFQSWDWRHLTVVPWWLCLCLQAYKVTFWWLAIVIDITVRQHRLLDRIIDAWAILTWWRKWIVIIIVQKLVPHHDFCVSTTSFL